MTDTLNDASHAIVKALADPERLRVFADIVLTDTGASVAELRTRHPHAEKSLALFESQAADPMSLANARYVLGRALWKSGQKARGKAMVVEAEKVFTGKPGNVRLAADAKAWLAAR